MPTGERDLVQQNIHKVDNLPRLHLDSPFFSIAAQVEIIEEESSLVNFVETETRSSVFINPPELKRFRGEETKANTLMATLRLPNFPLEVKLPKIIVLGTAENYAMTAGRLHLEDNNLSFQLARFHLGAYAELDMVMAMWPLAQIEEIKELLGDPVTAHRNTYTVNISREGHLTLGHSILARQGYPYIPYTIAHVEHQKDSSTLNQFGRITKVCPINFEGMNPHDISLLIVSDNTASGMQQVAVIDEALAHISNNNSQKHNLKEVLVLSPLLTLYGASIISYHNASEDIATTFVSSGGILGCNPPDRYFSPLKYRQLSPNPEIVDLIHGIDRQSQDRCIRCNWTASFAAPEYALQRSQEEMESYDSSNQVLLNNSRMATDNLKNLGIDPAILVPYSSYLEAEISGSLDILKSHL